MESIESARAKVLMERNTIDRFKEQLFGDLWGFEASHRLAEKLTGLMSESGSIIGSLEDYVNDPINSDSGAAASSAVLDINTYPFGIPTDELFPEFFGVCVGSCRFDAVLKAARDHLIAYDREHRGDDKQAVTIITDKWSRKVFSGFEPIFLTFALNNDVTFNFYLVTDYGITPVMFIDDEMKKLMKNMGDIDPFDLQGGYEKAVRAANVRDMTYTVEQYDSWLPMDKQKNFKYFINLEALRYEYRDVQGNVGYGTVKKEYARKFLDAALELDRAGGLKKGCRPTNYIENAVDMGSMSFSWFNTDSSFMSYEARKMVSALNALISSISLKKTRVE
ncbi:MAG: hypothetical protein ACI4K7_06905 [Oscillospiraceae bacterium]